jgi:phycobilisome core-membrane linker protein
MSAHASGGSPVICPQLYHTTPTAILAQAEQQDRWLKQSELNALSSFFRSGAKRIEIALTLAQQANAIVSAGAERIFFGGSPMAYLEAPPNRDQLPGYTPLPKRRAPLPAKERLKPQISRPGNPVDWLTGFARAQFLENRDPLPSGFRPINVARYGPIRMKRSMRDLSWFLRYVTYAIVSDNPSILSVNVRGLRGVIPEDVTEATVVAIKDMRWKALSYFKQDAEASAIVQEHFDVLVSEYLVEKPPIRLRQGFSNDKQGLQLPESYALAATSRPKFVLKPSLSVTEQQEAIQAAYRQVFERDITRACGLRLNELESKVKSGELSTKEFIRQLGKSRLYRREYYEPFVISRVIELAVRHFLGRGLSSIEEFQEYFEVISKGGLPALVDALVDSQEYSDYFGEETVPYLRGLGQEAQECRNWGPQLELFKFNAAVRRVPQFITLFGDYQHPLPNQHPYGATNDPLEIQFGAIFPHPDQRHTDRPATVGKDHQRILIRVNSDNGTGNGTELGAVSPSHHRIIKFDHLVWSSGTNGNRSHQGISVSLSKHSPTAVIQAAYRQVFGREVFEGQRLTTAEVKLKSGEITMREFVRQLAKSRLFRQLYWDSLYITKAIEYIHRRLLGRPTHGRQEMSHYYDLCARQGFHAFVDALIDSDEYLEVFGEDTVPYERFVTPRGYELRSRNSLNNKQLSQQETTPMNPEDHLFGNGNAWVSMMKVASNGRFNHLMNKPTLQARDSQSLLAMQNLADSQLIELKAEMQSTVENSENSDVESSEMIEQVVSES